MDKQHILGEIDRTAKANGGVPLGKARFLAETGIRFSDWYGKYWKSWGDALREAGYQPNKLIGAYNEEFIINKLIEIIHELGRFPVSGELRMKRRKDASFPSHSVFDKLGNKAERAKKVIDYCKSRDGLDDVISICEPIAITAEVRPRVLPEGRVHFGFVYLLRSGRYFKIGRTNSVGRREYELGIQLPEPAKLVHQIKTDDPIGIEEYWHKRFKDKRKGGEWFDLTPGDVAAFKRHKIM